MEQILPLLVAKQNTTCICMTLVWPRDVSEKAYPSAGRGGGFAVVRRPKSPFCGICAVCLAHCKQYRLSKRLAKNIFIG